MVVYDALDDAVLVECPCYSDTAGVDVVVFDRLHGLDLRQRLCAQVGVIHSAETTTTVGALDRL